MTSTTIKDKPEVPGSSRQLKFRLAVMMFLQYFVQGCYLPIISVYLEEALHFSANAVGLFGSALAVGPLLAPFVLGQLVDRKYATQHVLTACHFSGGIIMLLLYFQEQTWAVIVLGTLYSILYVPSLMLTNSLAFHHLQDREREFPLVRLWGTIGFILPAWLIERILLRGVTGEALNQGRGVALAAAGIAGIIMAGYSLSLPHTPPARDAKRTFAPMIFVDLLRERRFLVLILVSFFVAIVHKFYFVLNAPYLKTILRSGGVESAWEGSISSLGQIAEIGVMAALGLIIARIGFKWTIQIGAIAYLLRCLIFAFAVSMDAPFEVVIGIVAFGQLLHGLCFGCFLAAAFIFFDRTTPSDTRGSVQNIYGTFVVGTGFFFGGMVSGLVREQFRISGEGGSAIYNWTGIWLAAAALSLACVIAFQVFFPKQPLKEDELNESERKAAEGSSA